MAGNAADTIVIDITTEYTDKTDSGLDKAAKKADKFADSMVKAKKQAEALKKTDTTIDLKANDKATAVIHKTRAEVLKFGGTTASATLGLVDRATTGISKVKGGIGAIAGKTYSFTATLIDKATAPLQAMLNYAMSVKGIITGVLAGMAVSKFIAGPTAMADTITTALIGFETKFKDAQKAADFMAQIEKFAIETPFETNDLIGISQRMLAMNWNSETLISDLNSIGNAAAATGKGSEGIQRMTLALSQMQAKGKVSAEEMMQLTEAGVNGWDYLAKNMEVSVAEVQQMTEKNLIPVDRAIRAIIDGMDEFDGMMEKTANKTVSGLKSQIKDTFDTKIVLKWGQGLQEGGIVALSGINDWLGRNAEKVKVWGEKFKTVATDISTSIGNVVRGSLEGLDTALNRSDFDGANLFDKVSIVWEEVITKPMEQWWKSGGEQQVQEIFSNVAAAAGKMLSEGIPMALKAVFSNGVTGTLAVAYGAKTGASLVSGIVKGLGGFKPVELAIIHLGEAMALSKAGFSALAGEASLLFKGLTLLTGPVGLVIGALALLGIGIASSIKEQKEHKDELMKLGDAYQTSVQNMEDANKAYDENAKKLKDNAELIKTYRDVTNEINSGNYSGDELNAKLEAQAATLEQLKGLYPQAFGEGVSTEAALTAIDELMKKEQDYQELLKERARISETTAKYELIAKLPEMEKLKADLEEQIAKQDIEVKAHMNFKDNAKKTLDDLDYYNGLSVDARVNLDKTALLDQLTQITKDTMADVDLSDEAKGQANLMISAIRREINSNGVISAEDMTNLGKLTGGFLDGLVEEQAKLEGLKSELKTTTDNINLAKGVTDEAVKSADNLKNTTDDLSKTAESTNTTTTDTLTKTQQTETSAKSAEESAAKAVTDTQTANTNAEGLQGKLDTANTSLAALNGAMGELDTGGYTEKLTGLIGITDTTMETVKNSITIKSTEAVELAKDKFEELPPYVKGLTPQFYTIGQAMMHELISGIDSMKSNVGGEIDSVVSLLLEKFRSGLGIHSPSTILREIGRYAAKGLVQGLGGEDLLAFCNSMVEDIKAAFEAGNFDLKVGTKFIGDGAAEFFKSIGVGGATVEGLLKPVDGMVTDGFGWRTHPITGEQQFHAGIDIGASEGTPVLAAGAGEVTTAGWYGGYGNAVIIDHGNGLETLYGHLSSVLVSVGQMVSQLEKIGLVGSTGNSTGPHLHFEINQGGNLIDPGPLWGYARGTRNATPGIHWVGENGPELVGFDGGEAVLNAYQSKDFSYSGGTIRNVGASKIVDLAEWRTNNLRDAAHDMVVEFKDGIKDMKDPVATTVAEFTDNIIQLFQEKLDASKLTAGSGSSANWQNMDAAGWIKEAMAIAGVSGEDNFNHLMEIAQNESSFNPGAINDWDSNAMAGTPSMGLMQTIQSTFDSYALPGHNDIWNPIDNAVAAIRYMIDRYGSILNTGTHGYAGGVQSAPAGLAWVGENGPELMNFRGGESVISSDMSAKIVSTQAARARSSYLSNSGGSASGSNNDGGGISISLGGIHITIEAGNAGSTEEIIAAVQAQIPGIANDLCREIAQQVAAIYSGMPTKVGAA